MGFFPKSRDLLAITKQVCCSVLLQCVIAVCYCSVLLQCVVAVCCCSVLQCVAISLETCLPSSHLLKRNEFYQCILANFAKTDKIVCQCQKCRAPCDVPYFFFGTHESYRLLSHTGESCHLKMGRHIRDKIVCQCQKCEAPCNVPCLFFFKVMHVGMSHVANHVT